MTVNRHIFCRCIISQHVFTSSLLIGVLIGEFSLGEVMSTKEVLVSFFLVPVVDVVKQAFSSLFCAAIELHLVVFQKLIVLLIRLN